jgi:bacterioferritin-associated ferredoxin
MIVCLCSGVSDRVIRLVIAKGARTADAIEAHCGAGGGCGGCRETIEKMLDGEGAAGGTTGARASCPRATFSVAVSPGA